MTVSAPAWLGLLALPALLFLAHLLNRGSRTHAVSSLRLWRGFAGAPSHPRRLWFPRVDASLVIGLLVLSCLALAAAGPWLKGPRKVPAFGVFLDRSWSMSATSETTGARRIDVGRRVALALLRESADAPARFLFFSEGEPRVVAAAPGEMTPFEAALSEPKLSEGDPSPRDIAAAAAVVRAHGGGRLVVVSDFAGAASSLTLQQSNAVDVDLVSVGEAAPNIAVTSLVVSRHPTPEGDLEAVATVTNAFPIAHNVALTAEIGGRAMLQESLTLDSGATAMWRFPVENQAGAQLEVRAFPGGAVATDDVRVVPLPHRFTLNTSGDLPDEIEAALAALAALRQTGPGSNESTLHVELLRDRLPGELPPRWLFLSELKATSRGSNGPQIVLDIIHPHGEFLEPFHPILVDPTALPPAPPPSGASPIALAGGLPVVSLVERAGSRGIYVGIPLEATDLGGRGALPLVLTGILDRLTDRTVVERVDRRPEEADLTPRPPSGARTAEAILEAQGSGPVALRTALLSLGMILVVLEAVRRSLGISGKAKDLWPLAVILLLLITAAVKPRWTRQVAGTLAVLFDVSASIPPAQREEATKKIAAGLEQMPHPPKVAVFTFDEEPRLVGLGSVDRAGSWLRTVAASPGDGRATDLGRAIEEAERLVRASAGGSILVVTDGRDLGSRGAAAAEASSQHGAPVHVVPLERTESEAALELLQIPGKLRLGQVFEALALVRSTVRQRVKVTLETDGTILATQESEVSAGTSHAFRFLVQGGTASGVLSAHLSAEHDTDPGNNLARARLAVYGAPRFATIALQGAPGLEGDSFDRVPPRTTLDRYDGIFVRLGGGLSLSTADQEALARYVSSGHGLVVSCDDPESAVRLRGGPLERILPVRLHPPRQSDDESAVVLLVDRSGSMDPGDSETSAMSWAKRAVDALALLLNETDRYGLIAFDVAPHVLRPLRPVDDPGFESRVLPDIEARGGTDWSPALDLALDWLDADTASFRHVILVGDGRLGPGATESPTRAWPDGVTLSTVAVGNNADRTILERLAAAHGGRYDHVSRPQDLPVVLRREAAHLRAPGFRTGPIRARASSVFAPLIPSVAVRPGKKLIVVSPLPTAEVALQTDDGEPLLAFGQAGWGRSAFLATDPAGLDDPARIVTLAMRRVSGSDLIGSPLPSVAMRGATATVEVVVDEETQDLPRGSMLSPSGEEVPLNISWTEPRRAGATFILTEVGDYVVDISGRRTRLSIASPPERTFLPRRDNWAQVLASSGKGQVITLSDVQRRLPDPSPGKRTYEFATALLTAAAFLFFLDALRALGLPHALVRRSGGMRK